MHDETTPRRGRGRPARPPEAKRGACLSVHATPAEIALWREAAQRDGLPASEWARKKLVELVTPVLSGDFGDRRRDAS